jgi:hypothetical protein
VDQPSGKHEVACRARPYWRCGPKPNVPIRVYSQVGSLFSMSPRTSGTSTVLLSIPARCSNYPGSKREIIRISTSRELRGPPNPRSWAMTERRTTSIPEAPSSSSGCRQSARGKANSGCWPYGELGRKKTGPGGKVCMAQFSSAKIPSRQRSSPTVRILQTAGISLPWITNCAIPKLPTTTFNDF